jgi:hypothetical protein
VLKPTGSLYLHCDPTASHYLKLILDGIFGGENYRSEISWRRSSSHNDTKQGRKIFGQIRDVLLFYTKSKAWTWNPQFTEYEKSYVDSHYRHVDEANGRLFRLGDLTAAKPGGDVSYQWRVKRRLGASWSADLDDEWKKPKADHEYKGVPPYRGRFWAYSKANMAEYERNGRLHYSKLGMPSYKRFLDEMLGVSLQNDWQDIPPALGKDDLGYPTQKPPNLLERILNLSSNAGDLVLDPFCGCGTAVFAAEKLGRRWIGIDVTHLSISLIERRMRDAFPGIEARYEVIGTPKDLAGARELAARDKYQFQWWAVGQVGARPYKGKKKGADGGIDGIMYFKADKRTDRAAIVSVKGGDNLGVGAVRDLIAVLEREKGHAEIGILICAALPTRAMEKEAAAAGFYKCEAGEYPRVQIVTLAELFQGLRPKVPFGFTGGTFKAAAREDDSKSRQGDLI